MKMKKGLLFSVLLVAGLVFVGFSPQSYAATQKKNLIAEVSVGCTGSTVGRVVVKKKGSDVLVKVKITNGTPSTSRTVYWACQYGTGCHEHCAFKSIGTITTDGSGKGKFKYKGPIPIDGTMHFDILNPSRGNYYSGIFAPPSDELVEASEDVIEGDPTLQ